MKLIYTGLATLAFAGTLFAAQSGQASGFVYLMKLECRFDNGVLVLGTRPAEKNAWAPFDAKVIWGFSWKYMSAYYESLNGEIKLWERIPATNKGYEYIFKPEHKPGLSNKETIPGVLVGPTGETHGICNLELQDHS